MWNFSLHVYCVLIIESLNTPLQTLSKSFNYLGIMVFHFLILYFMYWIDLKKK